MSGQEARDLAALVAWERPDLEMCGDVWPQEPSGLIVWDARRELHIVLRSPDDWREYQAEGASA